MISRTKFGSAIFALVCAILASVSTGAQTQSGVGSSILPQPNPETCPLLDRPAPCVPGPAHRIDGAASVGSPVSSPPKVTEQDYKLLLDKNTFEQLNSNQMKQLRTFREQEYPGPGIPIDGAPVTGSPVSPKGPRPSRPRSNFQGFDSNGVFRNTVSPINMHSIAGNWQLPVHDVLSYREPRKMANGQCGHNVADEGADGDDLIERQKPTEIHNRPRYCRAGFETAVLIKTPSGSVCSGILLSHDFALTARHCTEPTPLLQEMRLYLSRHSDDACLRDAAGPYSEDNKQLFPGDACRIPSTSIAQTHVVMPQDYPQGWNGDLHPDIALLKLKESVPLLSQRHNLATPSAYPRMGRIRSEETLFATAMGFGRSGGPNAGPASPFNLSYLKLAKPATKLMLTGKAAEGIISTRIVDEGQPTLGVACRGDSGSPVLAGLAFGYLGVDQILIGIATHGHQTCSPTGSATGQITPVLAGPVHTMLCRVTLGQIEICEK
jgi:Trypsin